jgi:electron transfer flavoprotein alpha/beta subunit
MVKVGDRIRLSSGKGPYRDGVVAAVTGSMVRVRWPSEEETTVIPAPGTLTVLTPSGDQAPPAVRRERSATKKAAPKKTTAKKAGTKKSTTSKTTATAKKDGTKKTTGARKGGTKKTTGAKRSSR